MLRAQLDSPPTYRGAKSESHDLSVVFLDVATTFDTLPHDAILGALKRSNQKEQSLAIVASIFRGLGLALALHLRL